MRSRIEVERWRRVAVRSGSRSSAPTRKQRPPTAVPRLTSMMLRGSPVVGTIFDATADTPNAIDPAGSARRCATRCCGGSTTTSRGSPRTTRARWRRGSRSTRRMSGTHTRRWAWVAFRLASMAANVVTLKNTVPTSCTALADQSMRPGSQVQKRSRSSVPGRSACGALSVCEVLQVRGGGEEDRADEERDRVGVGARPSRRSRAARRP